MRSILDLFLNAFLAVPPATLAKYALIGAAIGTFAMPAIMFIGFKLNLKRVHTIFEASKIPQTPRLYRLFATAGAVTFAIIAASQPVLDAAGKEEVWIRGALIPLIMLVGWPFVRALRKIRDSGT